MIPSLEIDHIAGSAVEALRCVNCGHREYGKEVPFVVGAAQSPERFDEVAAEIARSLRHMHDGGGTHD